MLKDGLDVYVPLVDDDGIDAIIRKSDGTIIECQIKARSVNVAMRDAALFAAIQHDEVRPNYFFIFYSERLDTTWVMSSEDFVRTANQNKTGKNAGKRSIWFNGTKTDRETKKQLEYPFEKFHKYKIEDFSCFRG